MALHVDFNNRVGYYTLKQGDKRFKIHFCTCNALIAEIYFEKNDDGVCKILHSFFGDLDHLKRCAKAKILNHYGNGVTLYASKMTSDHWKMARVFAENGIKVTIK